jgi:hypothetical protein
MWTLQGFDGVLLMKGGASVCNSAVATVGAMVEDFIHGDFTSCAVTTPTATATTSATTTATSTPTSTHTSTPTTTRLVPSLYCTQRFGSYFIAGAAQSCVANAHRIQMISVRIPAVLEDKWDTELQRVL